MSNLSHNIFVFVTSFGKCLLKLIKHGFLLYINKSIKIHYHVNDKYGLQYINTAIKIGCILIESRNANNTKYQHISNPALNYNTTQHAKFDLGVY